MHGPSEAQLLRCVMPHPLACNATPTKVYCPTHFNVIPRPLTPVHTSSAAVGPLEGGPGDTSGFVSCTRSDSQSTPPS